MSKKRFLEISRFLKGIHGICFNAIQQMRLIISSFPIEICRGSSQVVKSQHAVFQVFSIRNPEISGNLFFDNYFNYIKYFNYFNHFNFEIPPEPSGDQSLWPSAPDSRLQSPDSRLQASAPGLQRVLGVFQN